MQAKRRTLLFLLVCVLAAGAALALLTRQNRQAERAASQAQEGTISLSAFAAEQLTSLSYTYAGETLTLNCRDGAWTLEGDEAYHLDASACNTMVTALSALNAKRRIEPEAGEDYGFASPPVTVTFTAAGQTNTFVFGAANNVTGDIYLQKQGDTAVYTVSASKMSCFEKTKQDLFGAFNPAGLTASALEQVRYTLASGETVAFKAVSVPADDSDAEGGESSAASQTEYTTVWRLESDPDAALDQTKIDSLLAALSSYVSAQITQPGTNAQYGLEQPLVTVEATTAQGTQTLAYGCGEDGYYLAVSGGDSVYRVDESSVQALCLTAQQLLSQQE